MLSRDLVVETRDAQGLDPDPRLDRGDRDRNHESVSRQAGTGVVDARTDGRWGPRMTKEYTRRDEGEVPVKGPTEEGFGIRVSREDRYRSVPLRHRRFRGTGR